MRDLHPTITAMARAYNAALENPTMVDCPRCAARGYHHGFGETGHDPDWCENCGGAQYVMKDEHEPMLAALRALAACEPSEGAVRTGLIAFAEKVASRKGELMPSSFQEQEAFHAGRLTHSTVETMEVWRAMLAELVKECERDA